MNSIRENLYIGSIYKCNRTQNNIFKVSLSLSLCAFMHANFEKGLTHLNAVFTNIFWQATLKSICFLTMAFNLNYFQYKMFYSTQQKL